MVKEVKKEEEIVISWLKAHGYYRVVAGENNFIEADGQLRKMIVAVTDTQTTNNDFLDSLKVTASSKHREAWLAHVERGDDDITWANLK